MSGFGLPRHAGCIGMSRMEKPKWKDSLPGARTVSVPTRQVAARVIDGRWSSGNPDEVGSCRDGVLRQLTRQHADQR